MEQSGPGEPRIEHVIVTLLRTRASQGIGTNDEPNLDGLARFLRAKQPALSQNDIAIVAVRRA